MTRTELIVSYQLSFWDIISVMLCIRVRDVRSNIWEDNVYWQTNCHSGSAQTAARGCSYGSVRMNKETSYLYCRMVSIKAVYRVYVLM